MSILPVSASASGVGSAHVSLMAMRLATVARAFGQATASCVLEGQRAPRTLEELVHFGWDGQPGKKVPEYGDAEILPKAIEYRGSPERRFIDLTGRAATPALPADFLGAPDVAGLPWIRLRGDEWTDAAMRAVVLLWIGERFERDRLLTAWEVVETGAISGSSGRAPNLCVRLWRGSRAREVSSPVPESLMSPAGLQNVLVTFEPGIVFN